jgi:hypothetical protein
MRYLMELRGDVVVSGAELKGSGAEFLRQLLQQRADDLADIARINRSESSQVLWRWWWMLAEGSYKERIPDPSTGDYVGIDLRLGHVQLTESYGFELEGVKPVKDWPKALPVHAFALRELVGPMHLEIPPGSVQIIRLE